jgi:hypothetical protein
VIWREKNEVSQKVRAYSSQRPLFLLSGKAKEAEEGNRACGTVAYRRLSSGRVLPPQTQETHTEGGILYADKVSDWKGPQIHLFPLWSRKQQDIAKVDTQDASKVSVPEVWKRHRKRCERVA